MLGASRLPGQDGKTLLWRHMSRERTRNGDPAGGPLKREKPFLRVAREGFYQTTRNDSGQRVVNREKRAEKGNFVQIFVLVEERLSVSG
jgi:hypothetical protein